MYGTDTNHFLSCRDVCQDVYFQATYDKLVIDDTLTSK